MDDSPTVPKIRVSGWQRSQNCYNTDMNKINPNMLLNDDFLNAIQGLQSFVLDTGADIDMAYDWLCDQVGITSFVCDNDAWDLFYDTWETASA
jgi:hypothetical protein